MTKKNGYTLIEMMLALGIVSVVLMAVIFTLNFFWSKANSLEGKVSSHLDLSVLEKFLFKDLNSAAFSLGNINLMQSNPPVNFFDLYSQTPVSLIPCSNPNGPNCLQKRSYALDVASGGGSIEFIVTLGRSQDISNAGLATYFDPMQAYTGPPLTYVSLDRKGFFTKHYPTLYGAGNHFLFYSPATIASKCGQTYCPSYYYTIMGYPSGGQFIIDSMNAAYNHTHPLYPSIQITDMDNWFRYCPTIGGASCTVMVVPVNVIRYRLAPDGNGSGMLYRAVKSGNSYQGETLIAKDINRITFLRPDVTNALIQFTVVLKR